MARRDGGHTISQSGFTAIRLLSSKGYAPLLMSYRLISVSNSLNHQSHNFRSLPDFRSNLKIKYWRRTQAVNKAKLTYNQSRPTRQRKRRSQLPKTRRRRGMAETGAERLWTCRRQVKLEPGYAIRHQPSYQALLHSLLWFYKGSGALFNQLQNKLRVLGGCWRGVSEVVFSVGLTSLSSGSVFDPFISEALFGSALLFRSRASFDIKCKWRPAFDSL